MIRYVTFGQKYAYEPHPKIRGCHPDGVLQVVTESDDYGEFREFLCDHIGTQFAFDYGPDDMKWELFPRGITHRLDKTGLHTAPQGDDALLKESPDFFNQTPWSGLTPGPDGYEERRG